MSADSIRIHGWGVMWRYPVAPDDTDEILIKHTWWLTRDEARAFIAGRRGGFLKGESMRVVKLVGELSPVEVQK